MSVSQQASTRAPSKQRLRKEAMLASFQDMCTDAEGLFVAEYSGIDVDALAQLRKAAKKADGQMLVVKNTVARIAVSGNESFAPLAEHLQGQLIYGAGSSAPALAKALRDFAKDNEQLKLRAGAMGGEVLVPEQINKLADLPTKDGMIAILAGTLNAPIAKFARTLAEVPSSLARVLAAARDAKGAGGN